MVKTALLFFGGFAFICFGLWFGLSEQIFLRSSAIVSGKISSKPEMYIHLSRRSAYPKYRFNYTYIVDGRNYEAFEAAADDTFEPLTVYYDKSNPPHSRLKSPEPSLGYKIAGIGFVIISISALCYYREKKRAT